MMKNYIASIGNKELATVQAETYAEAIVKASYEVGEFCRAFDVAMWYYFGRPLYVSGHLVTDRSDDDAQAPDEQLTFTDVLQ